MHIEDIGKSIIDSCFAVHSELGPGVLESAYEQCLSYELQLRGHTVERQKPQPITYKELTIEDAYKIDLLVDDQIIIELKTVDLLLPVHHAQLLTYLKFSKKTLGYLVNFRTLLMKDGLHRKVLNHPHQISPKNP